MRHFAMPGVAKGLWVWPSGAAPASRPVLRAHFWRTQFGRTQLGQAHVDGAVSGMRAFGAGWVELGAWVDGSRGLL